MSAFVNWPREMIEALERESENGNIGQNRVFKNDHLEVWYIDLHPGEAVPFHRHAHNYFWTCLTEGKARSYYSDGRIADRDYLRGDTVYQEFQDGNYMVHNLVNIGESRLTFVTVQFPSS